MKKTLLILAMALGSICTFAQGTWQKPIPTKASLLECQFTDKSQVVTGHYYPSHTIAPQLKEKGADTAAADFRWVKNTSEDALTPAPKVNCMVIYNSYPGMLGSPTKDNGFVLVAPIENATKGGECSRQVGGYYDTYVMLKDSFSTIGITSVQVEFYQSMFRVNRDRFFVEWSENKDVWDTVNNKIEINLAVLDVAVGMDQKNPLNGGLREMKKVSLLASASNKSRLWIRFRYSSQSPVDSEVPGYFWMIDDLKVTEGPAFGVEAVRNMYYDNAYHYIPKGLIVPPVRWYGTAYSSGGTNATGVKAVVEAIGQGKQAESKVASTMELGVSKTFSIDWDTAAAVKMSFPSTNEGSYNVTSKFTSTNAPASSFDTMSVWVRTQSETAKGNTQRWARDNGYLLSGGKSNYWNIALDPDKRVFETSDAKCTARGYQLCMKYKVDSTQKDSIFINGLQYVVSMKSEVGGQIIPVLYEQVRKDTSTIRDISTLLWGNMAYGLEAKDIPSDDPYTATPKSLNMEVTQGGYYMKPGYQYMACYTINSSEKKFFIATDATVTFNNAPPINNFGSGVTNIVIRANAFDNASPGIARDYAQDVPMIRLLVASTPNQPGVERMSAGSFKLTNYPNPATASTTINYELPVAATVSIELRDITGRTLKVVQLGKKGVGAGTYELDLSSYASGSYFYTLKANGLSETKKLIIVK